MRISGPRIKTMDKKQLSQYSKRLHYILRRRPQDMGSLWDQAGCVDVGILGERWGAYHKPVRWDKELAPTVGRRRGKRVILVIRSGQMHREQYNFCVPQNNVWLVNHVPAPFINFPEG